MKVIVKALFVSLIVYLLSVPGISLLLKLYPSLRSLAHPLIIRFVVFFLRLLFLFLGVLIFYTGSLSKVTSFIGLRKPFFRPFVAGFLPSLPFVIIWTAGCFIYDVPISFSSSSAFFLMLAFLGPGLWEEGLFRGVLFKEAATVMKWFFAALLVGIFFGSAHLANLLVGHTMKEVWISMIAGFVMSFPIGYMFFRMRGNLWACVSFHFFIAGWMDMVITEEIIKAYLDFLIPGIIIGLALTIIVVFVLFSSKNFVKFASGTGNS